MKKYRITYKQEFRGDILQDSYIRVVRDKYELQQVVRDLYSDPHVFSVTYEPLEANK